MKSYVLSVDQSTQGTKALLFDKNGALIARADLPHRQIISEAGWISHDPEEIFGNLLACAKSVIEQAGIRKSEIACMGITNQRETSLAWNRETGKPVCDAIVWQCARSRGVCERLEKSGAGSLLRERTGIPLSPYFPASKLAWILENIPESAALVEQNRLCMGTIDTWLIYKLTGGASYKTDFSNASRTQLFNLNTLQWDAEICRLFGIRVDALAAVCDSDSVFGMTDLGGLLDAPIPISCVLGDSHAALFGQGCMECGMTKATYGTGSSVMMNIGAQPVVSAHGLVTSLAWKYKGAVQYAMEGNLNYAGAVIRWLQKDVGLIETAQQTQMLAEQANKDDTTYIVPAFTGLGAPYWDSDAKAVIYGMTRLTGRAELVKAGLECIAYQITDIVKAMEKDTNIPVGTLRVDGGASHNGYLMQFQSDILNAEVQKPIVEELSGIGAAYMAGISQDIYAETVQNGLPRASFAPAMAAEVRAEKYCGWLEAVGMIVDRKKKNTAHLSP